MKATSKLISVVLILAMCLSLVTVSAFADGPVIVAPMEGGNGNGGKVVEYNYRGEGYGQPDPEEAAAADQNVEEDSEETPAPVVDSAAVEVATAAALQEALYAKAASIVLTEQVDWAGVLNLDYDVKIDLGGKNKGLKFSGSGAAAIVSSADAEIFNGNIFVSGAAVAAEDEDAAAGFQTVATSEDCGSVYLHGVYVQYTEAGENSIFGSGVSLGNGTCSQDVSAYYSDEAAAGFDFATLENGMFDVTAKAAAAEETADADEAEDAAAAEAEAEEPSGDAVTLTGGYGEGANRVSVTITGVNLPDGLTVEVSPLDNSMLQAEDGEEVLFVVDITLKDADGNVYEPSEDPNVEEVTVSIRHPALGNVEEGEAVTLYHIVNNTPEQVAKVEDAEGVEEIDFSTDSFSPYGAIKTTVTGSDGNVHYREVRVEYAGGDIYINDTSKPLEISFSGKKAPEQVSIVPYNVAGSGDYYVYTAGLLDYNGTTGIDYKFDADPVTGKPTKVIIDPAALTTAPDGKYGIILWFTDTDDEGNTVRVYMVQPIIIVNEDGVAGTGENFTPKAIDKFNEGTFDVEMCDNDSVKVKLTDELKSFTISGNGSSISYTAPDKKITIDGKKYNAYEYFTVGEYTTTDPASHEFIAGKVLTLHSALIKKLDFKDGYTLTVVQEDGTGAKDTGTFTLNIAPGITVADGLNDYIKGKNLWIKFQACLPIDYDADGTLAIWIGGQKISHDYYSISNDHMTLWIYRNLLDQLKSNNSYTLTARLWRFEKDPITGETYKETYYPATASFNILAAGSTSAKSPKTGDESNVALWASVLVLSGGAVVALIPKKKRSVK